MASALLCIHCLAPTPSYSLRQTTTANPNPNYRRPRLTLTLTLPTGDHGFDPMGFIPKFCDTPEKMELMKLKELKHARIAMIAITVCHHTGLRTWLGLPG